MKLLSEHFTPPVHAGVFSSLRGTCGSDDCRLFWPAWSNHFNSVNDIIQIQFPGLSSQELPPGSPGGLAGLDVATAPGEA